MISNTSRARCTRCESFGFKRAAVTASTFDKSSCIAGQPISFACSSSLTRISGFAEGSEDRPCAHARQYNMVPPTTTGIFPLLRISSDSRFASLAKRAAE